MARIPSRTSFDAVAGAGPATLANGGDLNRDLSGAQQMVSTGQAIRESSQQLSRLQIDAQNEANQLRANDALNKVRQRALDLTYNPDVGFAILKGQDALERPDGKPLDMEFGEKFDQYVNEVSATLGNDAQRKLLQQNAASVGTSLRSDAQRHMLQEFTNFHGSVADGALKVSQQEAELAWNDPDRVDRAINGVQDPETGERVGGIRQAIEQKARLTGMAPLEVQAEVRTAESNLHSRVITAALANNNVAYADLYFKQNRKAMTGSDILSVKKVLDDQLETTRARSAVEEATNAQTNAFIPNDMARLQNIVLDMESKGQRYDETGKLITSPKGAQGEMQVMPKTAKDPGYGVTPAKDDSPEELARVGRDYLTAMLREYGDVSKALAAYNAGPGAVDKAVDEAEKEGNPSAWLSKLPAETRGYVKVGVDKFSTGGGAAPMPTELEFVKTTLAQLPADATTGTQEKARELAQKQYKLITEARTQKGEQALTNAQRELAQNGGSFAELSAETKMNLLKYDPKMYDEATKFADAVRKGDDVRTNDGAYIEAVSNPGILGQMSDAAFQQYLVTNFSQADRGEVTKLRAGVLSGTSNQSADVLDNKTISDSIGMQLTQMGIDPNVKLTGPNGDKAQAQKVSSITRYIRDDLYNQQKTLGRRLTPEEIEKRVNFLFTRNIQTGRGWWADAGEKSMFDIGVSDIPTDVKEDLKAALISRGISKPTDDDLLRAYWRLRNGNAKQG